MEQSLRELVKLCTVRLLVKGRSQGTGFFVAPGMVLTCAHVVQIAQEKALPVEIYSWDGQFLEQVYVNKKKYFLEAIPVKDAITDPKLANLYPDLALLEIMQKDHLCVYLDNRVTYHDPLYSYGYTEAYPGGDGAEFTYEDKSWIDNQRSLLKFREGQALSGLSGGPLLNLHFGNVCGVVQKTRTGDMGGRAIPTQVVFQQFPELEDLQKQFHQRDTSWIKNLTFQQKERRGQNSPSPNSSVETIEVFYSYADAAKDKAMLEELLKHFSTLRRQGYITNWYAGRISPGEKPSEEVIKHLDTARIILLLISPDYLSSDELAHFHVRRAMERHATKDPSRKATVIPILLRSIDNWQDEPFGSLLAIPRNGKPISKWPDADEAFAEVAKEIRRVISNLRNERTR